MKVDKERTKTARKKQERGEKVLQYFFGWTLTGSPLNHMTGRAAKTPQDRRTWREWRDKTFPDRVRRRRRRKIAKASRKKNRC